jgi:hypothetical protein
LENEGAEGRGLTVLKALPKAERAAALAVPRGV